MALYEIEDSNGNTVRIEAPKGSSDAEVIQRYDAIIKAREKHPNATFVQH